MKKTYKNPAEKIFGENSLAIVAAVVTLLLQSISFATTWSGAKTYFSEVFTLAPLFFALSIQCTVFFLCNSICRKITFPRIAALILAILCSSWFSYIGIYNNVNSPEKYLEETYTDYRKKLCAEYSKISENINVLALNDINLMLNKLDSALEENVMKLSELEELANKVNNVKSTFSASMKAPSLSQFSSYEDYSNAYKMYISAVAGGSSDETSSTIQTLLSAYGYTTKAELMSDIAELKTSPSQSESTYAQISSLLGTNNSGIQESLITSVSSGKLDQNIRQAVSMLSELSSANPHNILYAFQVNQTDPESVMESYETVSFSKNSEGKQLSLFPMELKNALDTQIKNGISYLEELNALSDSEENILRDSFILTDIHLIPVMSILSAKTRGTAVICLTIAIITDLLSLIFALIFSKPKNTLTERNTKKFTAERSDLFEKYIISSVSDHDVPPAKRINEFLKRFSADGKAVKSGFSMKANMSDLSDFQTLLSILLQFDLASMVSYQEYEKLFEDERNKSDDMVFLKTKFLMWCNETFSSTAGDNI